MVPSSPDLKGLLEKLLELRQQVVQGSQTYLAAWGCSADPSPAIHNLARYLALRQQDLRSLQLELAALGLSSLGRCESRVLESLDAVIAILAAAQGLSHKGPSYEAFYAGDMALEQHTEALFGPPSPHRRARIMVTLPGEAAEQPELLLELLQRGMNVARINCAHDEPSVWENMLAHLRRAEAQTQRRCRVLMDLAGPKIRTGPVVMPPGKAKVYRGDRILLVANVSEANSEIPCQVTCTLPEILAHLEVGATVWIDDGKIGARVVKVEPAGVVLEIEKIALQGKKLRPEKGLNFPDSQLPIRPLTEKDCQDLDFVVQHADLVGYSFVQQPADLQVLFSELERRQARPELGLILKIETRQAVKNLPALIATAAARPLGVMIARGDLAVEIGWLRLGEIQEELLWICEAAHVPVVWATQVLDQLTKEGLPSRPELSDAVMSARAECVMLNKGPYLLEAVALLDELLARMQAHQHKKSQRLRALYSWQ